LTVGVDQPVVGRVFWRAFKLGQGQLKNHVVGRPLDLGQQSLVNGVLFGKLLQLEGLKAGPVFVNHEEKAGMFQAVPDMLQKGPQAVPAELWGLLQAEEAMQLIGQCL
jgi:hypothetical protein